MLGRKKDQKIFLHSMNGSLAGSGGAGVWKRVLNLKSPVFVSLSWFVSIHLFWNDFLQLLIRSDCSVFFWSFVVVLLCLLLLLLLLLLFYDPCLSYTTCCYMMFDTNPQFSVPSHNWFFFFRWVVRLHFKFVIWCFISRFSSSSLACITYSRIVVITVDWSFSRACFVFSCYELYIYRYILLENENVGIYFFSTRL